MIGGKEDIFDAFDLEITNWGRLNKTALMIHSKSSTATYMQLGHVVIPREVSHTH